MERIKEIIEQSTKKAKKILAENPGLCNMSYSFEGFTVEEVKQAGIHYGRTVELNSFSERYQFCKVIDGIAFHIRSKKVSIREVEEVDEDVKIDL